MDGGYNRGGYRGGWRGGGRSGGRFDSGYDGGYQQGGRGYDDGYRGGRGGGFQGGGYNDGYQGSYNSRGGYNDRGGYRGGGRGGDPYYEDGGGGYQGGRGGGYQDRGGRGGRSSRGRYNWGRGGGRHTGPPAPQRRRDMLPDDVTMLTELKKHEKQVTCLYYDPATQQLYSGGSDSTICAWSCSTGQLVSSDVVSPYGVDSIRVESGFMFVGMSRGDEGIVKVYNLTTGASHQLTGHKGQVYALAIANNALFTAGQDCSIRVWQFNEQAGIFMSQTILNATNGDGHKAGVFSLLVLGQYMFSGDRSGALKVWDLAQGVCVQTVHRAHDNAITTIMGWGEQYILTGSLDGTIKVWSPGSSPTEVVNPQPDFRYPEDEQPAGGGRGYRQPEYAGIVTMFGTGDAAGKSVLMVATVRERAVKLLELPTFTERGVLPDVFDSRALSGIPEHNIMLAGDRNGTIKIFQWKGAS